MKKVNHPTLARCCVVVGRFEAEEFWRLPFLGRMTKQNSDGLLISSVVVVGQKLVICKKEDKC